MVFFICRFFTGAGIGGEYAAINSAIDELIPARLRGRIDLMVNGSYWLGAAVGAAMTLVLLDENILAADIGWRVCFGIGAVLGLGILLVRRHVPESPRWLFIHGHDREADRLAEEIERTIAEETGRELPPPAGEPIEIRQRKSTSFVEIARTMVRHRPRRDHRAVPVREAPGDRRAEPGRLRLLPRRRGDDPRRPDRGVPRRQRRAEAAGGRRGATVGRVGLVDPADLISACRPADHGPAPDRPREPGRLSSPLIRTGG
jgi:hypothetical protein